MDLDLLNQLRESSWRSATDFVNVYTSNEDESLKTVNYFTGIKSLAPASVHACGYRAKESKIS